MDDVDAKRFSIIIPTYNYGHYLGRAIESVCRQPGNDYEIIVVDDGSTDDTAKVVKAYQDEWRRLHYVYHTNQGLAAARNLGAHLSSAEFLLFLDADDELLPHALPVFRSAIDRHEAMDYFIGGWVRVSSKGSKKEIRACPLTVRREENFVSLLRSWPVAVVNGSNIVHRRVFERLRFPESVRLWEDRVFFPHLFAMYSGISIEDPVVTVYRHADSLSHDVALVTQYAPKIVDLLFNSSLLPSELMSYRNEYAAVTQRMLFDALYVSGMYREARESFHAMFRLSPGQALTFRSIKRYLKVSAALLGRAYRVGSC